jgi:group II intron reverse transcriptase/maturase
MNPLDLMFRIADRANLESALQRVCANRGGPGIDGVRIDDFQARKSQELLAIESDLLAGTYQPDTIQTVTILKESGKTRVIGMMTIRDRVCAFAVTRVMRSLLEPFFQPCSYAYRPGRSATDAANYIEKLIHRGMKYVLETDIESYFDTINHDILMDKLNEFIEDSMVCELIRRFLKVRVTGAVRIDSVELGITQGSPLSPLFSNLYLNDLDKTMMQAGYRYVRYADDLVVPGKERSEVEEALALLITEMSQLELRLAPEKTRITSVAEGFVFLGFQFNETGKGPAMKSVEAIRERLHEAAAGGVDDNTEKQINDLQDIIRGWRQYFQMSPDVFDDMPATVLAAALREAVDIQSPELFRALSGRLWEQKNRVAAVHACTGAFMASRKRPEAAACHYLAALMCDDVTEETAQEALTFLEIEPDIWESLKPRIVAKRDQIPSEDAWRDLSEMFAESGHYELAMVLEGRVRDPEVLPDTAPAGETPKPKPQEPAPDEPMDDGADDTEQMESEDDESQEDTAADKPIVLPERAVTIFARHFRGRDGILAFETIDEQGNKQYCKRDIALSRDRLEEHWAGNMTYGMFMVQADETVNTCLFDIDVKKRNILLRAELDQGFQDYIMEAHQICCRLYDEAKQMGVHGLMEDSGYKGRHLWFFFEQPARMKTARQFLNLILSKVELNSEAVCVELFPGRDHLKPDKPGDLIKLPLGINLKSGRFSRFINRDGKYPDQGQALHTIRPITKKKLDSLLERADAVAGAAKPASTPVTSVKMSELESVPARGPIRKVTKNCEIMRYFINKAQKISHLTHVERVTLLHVFGHLGDEGKAFVHRVIACCMNYNPNYTQEQIERIKPSPISCPRIKEIFSQITVSLKCNCYFGVLPEGVYPTPVLYAKDKVDIKRGTRTRKATGVSEVKKIEKAGGHIRNDTEAESQDSVMKFELNELIQKYMNIRRNLRGIEKAIKQLEEKMLMMMQQVDMDAVETDFGTLRYLTQDGEKPRFILEI